MTRRSGWVPPHLEGWKPTKGERLDYDKFRALDRYAVVRHFGVNYRIDDQWSTPPRSIKMTAFGQDPIWHFWMSPDSTMIPEMCYWGQWPEDFCMYCGREWRHSPCGSVQGEGRYCPDCQFPE